MFLLGSVAILVKRSLKFSSFGWNQGFGSQKSFIFNFCGADPAPKFSIKVRFLEVCHPHSAEIILEKWLQPKNERFGKSSVNIILRGELSNLLGVHICGFGRLDGPFTISRRNHVVDFICIWSNYFDLTNGPGPPKCSALEGKSPKLSGNSRLVKYYSIWPDFHLSINLNSLIPSPKTLLSTEVSPSTFPTKWPISWSHFKGTNGKFQ